MKNKSFFLFTLLFFFINCSNNNYAPVPRAYFKFHFPEKQYEKVNFKDNFLFEKPLYSHFNYIDKRSFDLEFKKFNAILHFSYYPLQLDHRLLLQLHKTRADLLKLQHEILLCHLL